MQEIALIHLLPSALDMDCIPTIQKCCLHWTPSILEYSLKNLLEYVESCDRDSFTLPDFYSNIPQNAHIYFCMKIQTIPGKRGVLNIHQSKI